MALRAQQRLGQGQDGLLERADPGAHLTLRGIDDLGHGVGDLARARTASGPDNFSSYM